MVQKTKKYDFWDKQVENRKGNWMQTYTGKQYFPLAPHPDDVDIVDIAHSLALQCRFNGHCERFYSVAEHSTRCVDCLVRIWPDIFTEVRQSLPDDEDEATAMFFADYLTPLKKEVLLHDAAEAYLCDLPRPIKIRMSDYKQYEELNMMAVMTHFEIWSSHPVTSKKYVKKVDNIMLMTEKRDLMKEAPAPWGMEGIVEPISNTFVVPQTSRDAERLFLLYYDSLFGEKNGND